MKIVIKHSSQKYTDGGYRMEKRSYEISKAEADGLWVRFGLEECSDIQEGTMQSVLQEQFDIAINRPERNAQERADRHTDFFFGSRNGSEGDGAELIADTCMPKALKADAEYQEACSLVRRLLESKPEWAEIVIARVLDEEKFTEIAARSGQSEAAVRGKYKRAIEKLKKVFPERSI